MPGIEHSSTTERGAFPVLVLESQERMSVAVIRALGKAGYPVHATAEIETAAGLHSRFAAHRAVHPPIGTEAFLPWLREYIQAHAIRCVVPTEAFLVSVLDTFEEFAPFVPISDSKATLRCGINKFELFSAFAELGETAHLPPLFLVRDEKDVVELGSSALRMPLFLKADGYHGRERGQGKTLEVPTREMADAALKAMLKEYDRLVVQGYVDGIGVGAFLLRWNGQWLAEFMHRRLHEVPGHGWSAYREAWWHEDILADARSKLELLGWEGVAMMEYRWDPADDTFVLIEMNGRFWGSLHLALYAEVDFPTLLVDAFRGDIPERVRGASPRVSCRDVLLEARYVQSKLRAPETTLPEKLKIIAEFVRLSLDPNVRSDFLFPGDKRLAFYRLRHVLGRAIARLRFPRLGKT